MSIRPASPWKAWLLGAPLLFGAFTACSSRSGDVEPSDVVVAAGDASAPDAGVSCGRLEPVRRGRRVRGRPGLRDELSRGDVPHDRSRRRPEER